MQTALVYRTPIWKELLSLALLFGLGALGIFLIQTSNEEGPLTLVLGVLCLALAVPGAFTEVMSRSILTLDSEGICVRPYIFSKKRRIHWGSVVGFDKAVQTVKTPSGPTMRYTYLVLKTNLVSETLGSYVTETLEFAFKSQSSIDIPKEAGDIYIPAMRLPGDIDELLQEVRNYYARATGQPAVVTEPRPRAKRDLLMIWLLLVGIILFGAIFLITAITDKPVIEAGADIVLFFQRHF